MKDDNQIIGDILFKAFSDASIIYKKSNYPHLKKEDHETIKSLYRNIEASVKINIDLNYPNFNIKKIRPLNILDTFLQREHGIKFTREEIEKILNEK